jgi:hypothetical protein
MPVPTCPPDRENELPTGGVKGDTGCGPLSCSGHSGSVPLEEDSVFPVGFASGRVPGCCPVE